MQSQQQSPPVQHAPTPSTTHPTQQLPLEPQDPLTQQQPPAQQQQQSATSQQHIPSQSNQQQRQQHQHPLFNPLVGAPSDSNSPFVHPASTAQFSTGSRRLPHTSNPTDPGTSRGRNEQFSMQPANMHYQTQPHSNTTDLHTMQHHQSANFLHPMHTLTGSNSHHVPSGFTSTPSAQTSLTSSTCTSLHSNLATSHVSSTTSPGVVQSSSTVTTTSNIPPSLVNFQVDPDTGLPLSIINLQNGGMLKSTPTPTPVPQPVSESIEIQYTPSSMLLTSRDPVLSAGPLMSEPTSNASTQPLTVSVPTSSSSNTISSPPLISPTLMSPGLLSPTRHYSLLSPSELKKSSQHGTGLSGLGSVKVSLLLEPGALPQPPTLPQPPCPVEKLSPPTPSIRVSTRI